MAASRVFWRCGSSVVSQSAATLDCPEFFSDLRLLRRCQSGSSEFALSPGELPYGANMGFRTDVLKQFPFNPNLGRTGKTLFAHEEVDVLARMAQPVIRGSGLDRRVSHYIPPERLTARYLWRSLRESSQAQCRIEPPSPAIRLWGAPRWVWRAYFTNLAIQLCLSPLRSRRWLIAFKEAATMCGIIDEERHAFRKEPTFNTCANGLSVFRSSRTILVLSSGFL